MESNVTNNQAPATQPVAPAVDKKKSNKTKKLVALIIALVVFWIVVFCALGALFFSHAFRVLENVDVVNTEFQSQFEDADGDFDFDDDDFSVRNSTWTASDGSEIVFTNTRIDWYQDPSNHNDNYYSGTYRLYVGDDAIEYITQNMSEYGITRAELKDIFSRNISYDDDNFVVFDIRYDKFVVDGAEKEIEKPLVPWFGFVLNNNTYLDVANMNTGTYYKLTKKQG